MNISIEKRPFFVFDPKFFSFVNLQVHGEVTDPEVDIFDREKVFIDAILRPLIARFPRLKVVMEHVTTEDAVKFVESCKEGIS